MQHKLLTGKKAYLAPDFEIFQFITENVLTASGETPPTTTKPAAPELPEDEFRPVKTF